MISPYILIYQFIDAEEIRLIDQIEPLRRKISSSDPRHVSESDYDLLLHLRIKLDYLRFLSDKLLLLLKNYGTL